MPLSVSGGRAGANSMNDLQSEIAGLAMQAARKIVDDTKGNQDIYDQFLKGAGDAHVNEEVK